MSQFAGTLQAAETYRNFIRLVTDSSNDISVFEFSAEQGEVFLFGVDRIVSPNWTGTSSILYEVLDSLGVQLWSSSSETNGYFKFLIPLSGTYYFRLTTIDNNQAEFDISFRVPSIDGMQLGEHKALALMDFALQRGMKSVVIDSEGVGIIAGRSTLERPPATEFYGDGVLEGFLTVDAIYTERRVRLYSKKLGILIASTWSDKVTGKYSFKNLSKSHKYFVVGHDYEHNFNAAIADDVEAV